MINIKRSVISKKNVFYFINNRSFFLKYMISKNWLPDPQKKHKMESQTIDLKSLLDEKNVKIEISDIFQDYKYFKKAYYFEKNYKEKERTRVPFNSNTITIKGIIEYFFVNVTFNFIFRQHIHCLLKC